MLDAPAPRRPPRPRSRAGRIALGVLVALAVFAWAFEWTWCRPLIRHYVMSHSGRRIDFDAMDVQWRHGLDPRIEFRGLTIQNAPWAASREPFVRARRLAVTVSWRSLGADLTIVDLLELEDAQVDMERLADGLRNWRLSHPDDRGPPHVRVLALDARRSAVHVVHRGIGLDLEARSTPLDAPQRLAGHPELPLVQRVAFKGTFRDHAFEGAANASAELTFGATRSFALQGTARLGAFTLAAAGLSNDAHALGDLDVDARLDADARGAPWPLPAALARVRPLLAQGHVTKTGDHWTGRAVRLRAGRGTTLVADADFTGTLRSDTPRRTLKATLRDAVIDVDDLSLLRGKTPPGEPTLPGLRADAEHAPSSRTLRLDRLRELDADVDLRATRFVGAERGLAQTLRGHVLLAGGVLKVQGLDVGLGDGHVTGSVRVDASRTPSGLALDLAARGIRVDRLSSTLAANGALQGAVDGRADVQARGDSSRALVADAKGSVALSLAPGASVSRRLDARLGLNGGEWLRALFDKSARVPVQCAAVTLALDHGVATSRRFVFETPGTALAGSGTLDLVDESLDVTLTPAHKKLALLALDKAIHATGSWHDVKLALGPAGDAAPERCAP
jgi:AsmA family protein